MITEVTDIHLHEERLDACVLFEKNVGPRRALADEQVFLQHLLARCRAVRKRDYMIACDGLFFRGRRDDNAIDGVWHSLRRMPDTPPQLDTLPSRLPKSIQSMLLSPALVKGGLVYIVGSPGSGKTTTASATVVSRLHKFGGFTYTVEDPPEMPLSGWHGNGFCRQSWVAGDDGSDWRESVRGLLRSQPSGVPLMLFLGEVRDEASAMAMLRAAANGFLVISTGFATDIPSGLESLVKRLGGQGELALLASVLRLVVYQRLSDGLLSAQFLASKDATSPVAIKIRAGHFQHLGSDIQFQANCCMLGEEIL